MNFLNNLKLSSKLIGGYIIVLGLMIVIAIIVNGSLFSLGDSSKRVNQTYDIIINAKAVNSAMIDMESGQRGFVITGKDSYLTPFIEGEKAFDEKVAQGKAHTSNTPEKLALWDEIHELKQRWLIEAANPEIEARRLVTKTDEAKAKLDEMVANEQSKALFEDTEKRLLAIQTIINNRRSAFFAKDTISTSMDAFNTMKTAHRNFLFDGDQSLMQIFEEANKTLKVGLDKLRDMQARVGVKVSDVESAQDSVSQWLEKVIKPEKEARLAMNQFDMSLDDITEIMDQSAGKTLTDTIRANLQALINEQEQLIAERINQQDAVAKSTHSISMIGTLIAVIFGIAVATIITRGILGPLNATNAILRDIADGDGDLTIRVPINSQDEVGEMGTNFNRFIEKLQGIIRKISTSTNELTQSAHTLSEQTEKSQNSAHQQNEETEKVAAATTEVHATGESVACSAQEASLAAQEANNEAELGRQIVAKTTDNISELVRDVEISASVITKVQNDSENIGAVLDVIKGIAEQTNLLALNAAIEAARAGEQGRGFAVVADEVRTLAQRTQDSTSEIENLIETLQVGAHDAVKAMEQSKEKVLKTVNDASAANESLNSITHAVNTILEKNSHIATAAEEQNIASSTINDNIYMIQSLSEQNALGAEQSATTCINVAELSHDLQKLVDQFKI